MMEFIILVKILYHAFKDIVQNTAQKLHKKSE